MSTLCCSPIAYPDPSRPLVHEWSSSDISLCLCNYDGWDGVGWLSLSYENDANYSGSKQGQKTRFDFGSRKSIDLDYIIYIKTQTEGFVAALLLLGKKF